LPKHPPPTALQAHYNSLCDHNKERARIILTTFLKISETTFYRYLKEPSNISKANKWFICKVFNVSPEQLFNS